MELNDTVYAASGQADSIAWIEPDPDETEPEYDTFPAEDEDSGQNVDLILDAEPAAEAEQEPETDEEAAEAEETEAPEVREKAEEAEDGEEPEETEESVKVYGIGEGEEEHV